MLLVVVIILVVMFVFNWIGVKVLMFFFVLFGLLWVVVLLFGVYVIIVGVLVVSVIFICVSLGVFDVEDLLLYKFEVWLYFWVVFFIVLIFGFVNVGVLLLGVGLEDLLCFLLLGIVSGLFFGK